MRTTQEDFSINKVGIYYAYWIHNRDADFHPVIDKAAERRRHASQAAPYTFATRYLEANRDDLRGLAALLGHVSLDTVMINTQPGLDDLAERMERVEISMARRTD